MDEAALAGRFDALRPPNLDSARERAVRAAGLRAQAGQAAPPLPHRAGARARAILVAVSLGAVLVAGALTPPGQALATWIGERIGLGEPGGTPTLHQLRDFWTEGTGAEGQPAYVLARGPVPGGGRYEFITYRAKREPGQHWPAGARCFELDLTQLRGSYSAGCGVLPAGGDLVLSGPGGGGMPGKEVHYLSGRASDRVHSVEIEFRGRAVSAELVPVDPDLIERFHIARPFRFFIGFLDGLKRGGVLEVTARDAEGNVVERKVRKLPDLEAGFAKLCREVQRREPGAKSPFCKSG